MRRLRFSILIAGLLSLIVIFGCHPHSDSEVSTSGTAEPSKTTITALVWAPDWSEQMLQLASEYNQLNPDIRVNVQFMIGNSVESNIKPRIASGNLPDLLSVNPNAYAADLADQGILEDVSATSAWANMLDPLKADWISSHGKRFGIAGGVATTMIYYNKAMFAKAGIQAIPTNFPAFLVVCAKLKKAGFTPMVWNGSFPNMLGNGPFSAGFANNVAAHDAAWKAKLADGTLDLNTPEVADIFSKILLMPARGFVQDNYMATDYDAGIRLFKDGQAAMAFQGSWAAGLLLPGNSFDVGVFIPPWNAVGERVVPVIGSETGFAVGNTPNKAAAMRFLEFIAGKGFPIIQRKRQNIPPFQHMQGTITSDPRMIDYTARVSRYPITGSPYYSFLPSNSMAELHQLLNDVLLGKITPQQAAYRLDASVKYQALMHFK